MPQSRSFLLLHTFTLSLGCTAVLTGCSVQAPSESRGEPTADVSAALPATLTSVLPWGVDPGQVRLRSGDDETVAQGPSAVAVAPDGRSLVLDRLAGRVVRVGPTGQVQVIAKTPVDAMDLVAGPDGCVVTYSPLRATAWWHGSDGTAAGSLTVPRAFRYIQSLQLGPSRQLQVRTGYQETFTLGSPAAPISLPTAIRNKREGTVFLPDGRGVQSRVSEGNAQLWVLRQPTVEQPRVHVAQRVALGTGVAAARIVGSSDSTVCLRLERTTSNPQITVDRHARCIDLASGQTTFDEALPRPGLYLPHTELAMGADRLAFIYPTTEGLHVTSWRVAPRRSTVETNLHQRTSQEVQP